MASYLAQALAPTQSDHLAREKQAILERLALQRKLRAMPVATVPDTSLEQFVIDFWPVLEPDVPLVWGWYLRAICEHLEAVSNGRIRNLVINIPPRFSKSTIVSVMWPCWEWTYHPGKKFLFSSYGSDLSERDSMKCRSLIRSPLYRQRYGNRYALAASGDAKNTITKFENTRGGYRIATSVGGVATGEGADTIVVDDPVNAESGNSPTVLNTANRWWSETMTSRLNSLKTGTKVIVMQRLHENDLTGYVLAKEGGYEHLCLPMLYEVPQDADGVPLPKHVTALGWSDPRTQEGEILCPERAGPEEIAQLRKEGTEYQWAGQYQQRPAPREGGMFRLDRLEILPAIPLTARLIRARCWDRAGTQGGGAYTAGALISMDILTRTIYIEHMVRGQWATDQREAITLQTAQEDGRYVYILLEREPGSSGIDSVKATARMLTGFRVLEVRPTGSKEVRAEPVASQMALANVKLIQGPWNKDFLQEAEMFPMGRYRDQIDSLSMGFNWITSIALPARHAVVAPQRERFVVR